VIEESHIRQKEWEAVHSARDTLSETPDDAEANLTLGKYLCGDQQDWKTGLPLLAKGSNSMLAAAAKMELGGEASPIERLHIADAWFAAGTSGGDCDGFLVRATSLDNLAGQKSRNRADQQSKNQSGDVHNATLRFVTTATDDDRVTASYVEF